LVERIPVLDDSQLTALAARGVRVPSYDRDRVRVGVVHFGPGAFHRVHQACYFDDALGRDPRWGICEVSLRTSGVRDALQPQDGLYSIAILDTASSYRVIGAIREMLVAAEAPHRVLERLAHQDTQLVTATITEKGYCLRPDGALDLEHADVLHDLQHPAQPVTFVGYVTEALRLRRERRVPPPAIVSCDNLTGNGARLKRAVVELARQRDRSLTGWIENEVAFPSTMIDSITPATDEALRARVAQELGVIDRWPVQREFFTQWVIEDTIRGDAPDWASIGVTVTHDVAHYEQAKLRLLNGAHSTLAYVGSLAGYETVAQAMDASALSDFVTQLMRRDIAPTLARSDNTDYIATVLKRFRNPSIRHLLSQIAWDGSQKLPFRLFGTLADTLAARRPIDRLCVPIAAWFQFVRRKARRGERAYDPLADRLFELGTACTGDAGHDVRLFLSLEQVFPRALASHEGLAGQLAKAYGLLEQVDAPEPLRNALERVSV